jgi:hypothetical protein
MRVGMNLCSWYWFCKCLLSCKHSRCAAAGNCLLLLLLLLRAAAAAAPAAVTQLLTAGHAVQQ